MRGTTVKPDPSSLGDKSYHDPRAALKELESEESWGVIRQATGEVRTRGKPEFSEAASAVGCLIPKSQ